MRCAVSLLRSTRIGWKGTGERIRCSTRAQCHGEISDEDIRKLVGNREELVELVKKEFVDEEDDDDPKFILSDFPHRPQFLLPPSQKGTYKAKLQRQTDIIRWRKKQNGYELRRPPTTDVFTEQLPRPEPIPWDQQADLRPCEPLIHFPDKREPYSETRNYKWTRNDFIADIGDIYPKKEIEVTVTITNDVEASEKWAEDRLNEGHQIYGLETKWWTWIDPGVYFSDSHPGNWSDLALLQLATENEILLLQPLDTPVENLGPKLRTILKYKFLKKASFAVQPKVKALKNCALRVHGCHDFAELLKLQLGAKTVQDLPIDFNYQDLASLTRLLVGLDLNPREVCRAHWEQDYLKDEWIELAAMEAWSCWVLYGIVTRLDHADVELWCASLPDAYYPTAVMREQTLREKILRKSTVIMPSVYAVEMRRTTRQATPRWKVAKQSVVELAHDVGLDIQWRVEAERMAYKQTFRADSS